ncbi:Ig-like domain-containing protein, partial [Singulisphaera rosea]
SVWASTDLPYILYGTIVPRNAPLTVGAAPTSSSVASSKPFITLTIQSALPNTLLADGTSIPKPGESVVVKLLNVTNGAPAGDGNSTASNTELGGAGFLFGVDDGNDGVPSQIIDQGNKSELRILGIPGNETTGQDRIPAVLTSIHDTTVPLNVRGVDMSKTITGDTTAPAQGDGGVIYFGSYSQTTYNAFDIRDGSKIDNADIRYITRIEVQGGSALTDGLITADSVPPLPAATTADPSALTDFYDAIKSGQEWFDPVSGTFQSNAAYQQNTNKQLTISNSNLANFSQVGVFSHPGFQLVLDGVRAPIDGTNVELLMYNDTLSNMPVGVRVVGQNDADTSDPDSMELLVLNNTFYQVQLAHDIQSVAFNGTNGRATVSFVSMDSIYYGTGTDTVFKTVGQIDGSMSQYGLFFNNGTIVNSTGFLQGPFDNAQPIFGNPMFVDPTTGNFQLSAGSPAIDAARSELGLDPTQSSVSGATVFGDLVPLTSQQLSIAGGILNGNDRNGGRFFGGNGTSTFLSLPGYALRGYIDQWTPVAQASTNLGPNNLLNLATYAYVKSVNGVSDQFGFLRQNDTGSANVGFGSNPYYDIGAYEFRQFFPPHVTAVTATVPSSSGTGTTAFNIYNVGGIAGSAQTPQTIQFQFDHAIDPSTINSKTVLLEESGGDGIYGNNNSPLDHFIDLTGKLSFNSATNVLTISLGSSGVVLPTDQYRIFLNGSGANVIRDPQGNALDGDNTLNDDPSNPQLALPSGDGKPGGNFFLTFVINTSASSVVQGSLSLAPTSDTNRIDQITYNNQPSFTGAITDVAPQIVPLGNQTVVIDISTLGNGVFDRTNAGTAFTNADGTFTVTVGTDGAGTGLVTNTSPLPNSSYNV